MQAFTHLSGARRSVEHAVIGRRACEVEWDLLELLDPGGEVPGGAPAPAAAAEPGAELAARARSGAALHDRPTAVELLEAARGALGERRAAAARRARPRSSCASSLRALGIVRRELEQAPTSTRALHAAALAAVGVRGRARARRARSATGALDERERSVLAALRATVRAKLEVANPALPADRYQPAQGGTMSERPARRRSPR